MRIKLSTEVGASMEEVIKGFDDKLFKKLSPPFPKANLLRFDGSKIDDLVCLELDFLFFKQKWASKITDAKQSDDYYEFVDEGIKLPFFLKFWKHRHIIYRQTDKTIIEDNIEFQSNNKVTTYILFPFFYLLFFYRKPIYKRTFKANG
ncbi:SRPBCC family protein [Roseivirga pacifica]|uniref:SRPBCC family protein n=1 Tax=Roseivirga pacifica TaxID=1267423 RepID=UPI00227CF1D2|nr:hypothetical protein [Roseivirga pacifica]